MNLKYKSVKNYELTYLLSPELPEEEIKSLQEKINSLIQKEGSFINGEGIAPRRRSSFSQKKQKEVLLVNLNFQFPQEKMEGLEKELYSEKKILRYLFKVKSSGKETQLRRRRRRMPPQGQGPSEEIAKKPKTKVEFKEIEKKLDEILGE